MSYHFFRQVSYRNGKVLKQLVLVLSWEDWTPGNKLVNDAAEGPHVDGVVVREAKHDLWGSVVPGLYVEEPRVPIFAACSEVYYLNILTFLVRKYDVLWLHVTVYHLLILHVFESLDYLIANPL